jgi:hypothetical protein
MTAVITASRWHAIQPDYKSGSPTEGSARILRLTTDHGTVLVPTEVVTRPRLLAFGPSPPPPALCVPWSPRAQTRPGCSPGTALAIGATSVPRTTTPTTRPCAAGRASSAPTNGSTRLWIITDAETEGPVSPAGVRPRYATTLLLPSEY